VSDPTNSEELRARFDEARLSWPGIEVDFELFIARVGDTAVIPDVKELYLACACSAGNVRAVEEFDRQYLAAVPAAVARVDSSADFVAEAQQLLRERLLVGPTAKIHSYRGEGSLAGWVRTAAIRTALNLRRTVARALVDSSSQADDVEALLDPELIAIKERCQSEFAAALRRAVAALDAEDRVLLRFYYVDQLTLAKIAAFERVAVSTIYRRMLATNEAVLSAVKTDLRTRLQLSTESLDRFIGDAREDLSVSISQLLRTNR
jgi:RNA polymerase sigma-70 factor (ECF subfamily)